LKSHRAAFSVVELLVVVGIIVVLAAIGLAVMPSAKQSAQVSSTKARLHQLSVAFELYRTEYDGGPVGDLGDLGLPPVLTIATGPRRFLGLPSETWVSACAPHPHARRLTTMFYYPSEGGQKLVEASNVLQNKLLLIADDTCNPPDVLIQSSYVTKRGLGILLDGTLVDRRAQGDLHDPYWWSDPPETHL